jgi:3-hydroxyacyl-CoA dehydrogenase/3a,7a,12a-trihydroxy-5b-cholest-24-enoyl-CoA hydratase
LLHSALHWTILYSNIAVFCGIYYKMTLRFDGRVAVVTGAGRGMGRLFALFLASRGAKVLVNDLGVSIYGETNSNEAVADEVVRLIREKGGVAVADYNSVVDGQKIIEKAL